MIDHNPDDYLFLLKLLRQCYSKIIADSLDTARSVARSLDVLKTTVLKILHTTFRMFHYRFRRIQMLQPGDKQ